MELEATAGACPAPLPSLRHRVGAILSAIAWRLALAALLPAAWIASRGELYTPASSIGYWMGIVGGSLMLALLVYPLRKRFRSLGVLGPLRHWFRFHLVAGIAGPVIVLFHSTFHIGSFNAAIALFSMLLVVASGIVGRFLYRKIHHGLYGSRATVDELQQALERQMQDLQGRLASRPRVAREIARFSALVACQPRGPVARARHFLSLGLRRRLTTRRARQALGREADPALRALVSTLDTALQAIERSAYFSTYEKLFSLWHVVHIPFLCMLVVTALIHVVAVHAY